MSDEEAHLMDRVEVARALSVLAADGLRDGETFELRILGAYPLSGRFVSVEAAVDALAAHAAAVEVWAGGQHGGMAGAYFTPNPLKLPPSNDLARGGSATDGDVSRRRWFLLDVDPVRPKVDDGNGKLSKACATDEEKARAYDVRARILSRLCGALGWPRPVLCDSGNGYHALWAVDLPAVSDLPKRALAALAADFDTDGATVDLSVWNPSRIWKLPGTLAIKGPKLPDRPWRRARLEDVPERIQRVTCEQLEALAPAEAPRAPRAPDTIGSNERGSLFARIGASRPNVAYSADLADARAAYRRERTPADWPTNRTGRCPVHDSDGCFKVALNTNGERWICWSDKHPSTCGQLRDGGGYGGDVLDVDRYLTGKSETELLREAGYLGDRGDRATQEIAAANMAHVLEGARRGGAGELEDGGAFLEDAIRAAGAPPPGAPGAPVVASTKSTAPVPAAAAVPAALTNGPGELPELAPHLRPPRRAMLLTRPYALGERPEFEGAGEPGFLPRGIVAMLVGEGGGGKTQAAVQLAVAVATAGLAVSRESDAGRWLGTYKATERGRVALALGEEDDEEIHRRVWFALRALEEREEAAHDDFGFDKKRGPRAVWKYADAVRENVRPWALAGVSSVFIVPVDATPRRPGEPQPCDATDAFKAFEAALWRDGKPWSLVVLDPATRFLGADSETNNKAATEWMTLVHRLTKLPGNPAVLVIHHTNKAARKEGIADASASRGSSALTDGARWVATLAAPHRDDDSTVCDLRLTLVKANYVRAGLPPLELVRDDEHPNYLRPMTLREKDARTAERDHEAIELEATKRGREKAISDLAKTRSETIKAGLTAPPANVAGNASRGGAAFKASTLRGGQHTEGGDDDDQIRPR